MSDALFYLKFWRVGNGTLEPDKPANPMFDVFYGAFVSLFDGILSCDPDLLNLVWACYRDKRKNILTYSSAKKAIVQYEPPWQS